MKKSLTRVITNTLTAFILVSEVKKMQQKRLKVNFLDDDEDESSSALQKQINSHTQDITDVNSLILI